MFTTWHFHCPNKRNKHKKLCIDSVRTKTNEKPNERSKKKLKQKRDRYNLKIK